MRELAAAGAELSSLSAFALAQPLFDLLSRNAEVFAVRGSMSGDIVLFAVSLVVVPLSRCWRSKRWRAWPTAAFGSGCMSSSWPGSSASSPRRH